MKRPSAEYFPEVFSPPALLKIRKTGEIQAARYRQENHGKLGLMPAGFQSSNLNFIESPVKAGRDQRGLRFGLWNAVSEGAFPEEQNCIPPGDEGIDALSHTAAAMRGSEKDRVLKKKNVISSV